MPASAVPSEASSAPSSEGIALPALDLLEEIGRGASSIVYRARRGDRPVAVKVQRGAEMSGMGGMSGMGETAAAQFRREAAVLALVHHPALPTILEVGEAQGSVYLVMDYVPGQPLAAALAAGPLPVPDAVQLGKILAGALAELHRRGLVHRDVKPENVLLDGDGGATLIDFGFATQVSGASRRHEVAGTILYSAPEQLGLLNRPVDGRSDLYALGAVLYQCVSGRPPFLGPDAGTLLRQQAAERPPALQELNGAVSPPLAAIIAKLLEKDPDDRYQTGAGLLADLERVDALDAALRRGEEITLGQDDRAAGAFDELPLVGRGSDLVQLEEHWQDALHGQGQIVLVEGSAGAGKSRLVWELLRRVRQDGALVLAGKCAEADPLPFAPFRAAIEGWLRQIQQLPASQRRRAEERAVALAGEDAPLLRRLSPHLAALLPHIPDGDEQTPVPQQFHEAVAEFTLRLLGESRAGAALFLDDVQWIDEGSRQVLRLLAARLAAARLLVVCAVRRQSGDVVAMERVLDAIGGPAVARIDLQPLQPAAVERLVAAYLGERQVAPEFAHQIAQRSEGSPFAVGEYLRAALEAGVLLPSWGTWYFDRSRAERMQLPADVADLVVARIAGLAPLTKQVLIAAAVLGPPFTLDHLPAICDCTMEAVHAAVAEATRTHMIERRSAGTYVFVHDRVQEALLTEVDDAGQRRLHQHIATVLDIGTARTPADGPAHAGDPDAEPARVYALARHYALGEASRHPRRIYETNRAAGEAAVNQYADEEAYAFLVRAHNAARDAGIPVDRELDELLGELCIRAAKWNEASVYLQRALARSTTPVQRARLRTQLAQVFFAHRNVPGAWEQVHAAFADLKMRPPARRPDDLMRSLTSWLLGQLPESSLLGHGRASGAERERLQVLVNLYTTGAHVAYLDNSHTLMAQMLVRALHPAWRLGPSREMVTTYTGYAMLLATLRRSAAASRAAGRAVRTAERIGDRAGLARGLGGHAWARHVGGHPREAQALMTRCLEQHGRWLQAQDYFTAINDLSWNLLMRGYCREAWRWSERALHRVERGSVPNHVLAANAALLLTVLGRHTEAQQHLAPANALATSPKETPARANDYLSRLTLLHLERGELDARLDETIERHRTLNLQPRRASFHARHFYVFQAYARVAQCLQAARLPDGAHATQERRRRLEQMRMAGRQLDAAATHPTLRCHATIVAAARAHLEGNPSRALRLLERGERLATQIDSPWAAFEIARHRAHALRAQGDPSSAAHQANAALSLAAEHGWVNRGQWIRAEFAVDTPPAPSTGLGPSPPNTLAPAGDNAEAYRVWRRYDALLRVSLATASVLDANDLARVALDQVISSLTAERGYLFLWSEEQHTLLFQRGRDARQQDLPEPEGYSRSVVEAARATREPVVVTGTHSGEAMASESIVTHDLRSIMAVPLMTGERLVGVVYVDSRVASGVFGPDDVSILLAITNHIAVAVTVAQAYTKQAALAQENQRLVAVLRRRMAELRASRERLTEVEERQRREIAEMLHGTVQSKLLLAAHRLEGFEQLLGTDPAGAAALVASVRQEIDRTREQDVRRASHLLHPSIIGVGLVPALYLLAERFESSFRVRIEPSAEVAVLDDPIENQLSEPLRLCAYRVVEEALTNVARHARAASTLVSVAVENEAGTSDAGMARPPEASGEAAAPGEAPDTGRGLVITVRDDGQGFDTATLRPGLGLTSIRGRVEQAGGTWRIESAPGAGATLLVRLPLTTQPPA